MNPNLTLHCGSRSLDGATLQARADRAAGGFQSLGLKPGDTVAVMLRNDLPYLELMLALGRLGVHLVAVNWHFQAEEAAYVFQDSGARALVIHADLWPRLAAARFAWSDYPSRATATWWSARSTAASAAAPKRSSSTEECRLRNISGCARRSKPATSLRP